MEVIASQTIACLLSAAVGELIRVLPLINELPLLSRSVLPMLLLLLLKDYDTSLKRVVAIGEEFQMTFTHSTPEWC